MDSAGVEKAQSRIQTVWSTMTLSPGQRQHLLCGATTEPREGNWQQFLCSMWGQSSRAGAGGGGRYGKDESSKPPLSGRTAFRTGQDLPIAYRSELRLGVGWLSLWGTHTDGSRSVPLPLGAWCSLRSLLGRPLLVLTHPRTREPAGVRCSCASDPPEGAGAAVSARSGPGVGDRSTGAGPS